MRLLRTSLSIQQAQSKNSTAVVKSCIINYKKMIVFNCPNCQVSLQLEDCLADKIVTCGKCGAQFSAAKGKQQESSFPRAILVAKSVSPIDDPLNVGVSGDSMFLHNFIGQQFLKSRIAEQLNHTKCVRCPMPHMLFAGSRGCGKQTLAKAIANELGTSIQIADGQTLKTPRDLMPFLTNLEEGSLLVVKGAETLPNFIIEFLLPALDDCSVDITLGEGVNARKLTMPLKKFTFIGTTIKPSRIDGQLVGRLVVCDFDSYDARELQQIAILIAKQENLQLSANQISMILSCVNGSIQKAQFLFKQIEKFSGKLEFSDNELTKILRLLGHSDSPPTSIDLISYLRGLDGMAFEETTAKIFRGLGYKVEQAGGTGDHGIDLVLQSQNQTIAVQCKCWEQPVGEPVVRDFFGSMLHARATSGFIVTTSQFTAQAVAFANDKAITLIDIDELLLLIKQSNANIP